MENVVNLDEVRTKAAKTRFINATKELMGLSSWDITYFEDLENGNMGECYAEPENKVAEIYLQPGLSASDFKRVVIHELSHCVTARIRDVEYVKNAIRRRCGTALAEDITCKIEKELWKREEEVVTHFEDVIFNILEQCKK